MSEDFDQAHGAMRVVTDVVSPCVGPTQRWGGWPPFYDHGGVSVVTYYTCDFEVSIHGYGLLSRPRYDVASWGGLG